MAHARTDVEPTAEAIESAAKVLEHASANLRRLSARMRETGDLTIASEAMGCIQNMWHNMRLDLLITRPLRAAGIK